MNSQHFMVHEDTERAERHTRPCPEISQTTKTPCYINKGSISLLFSDLFLGLTSGILHPGSRSKIPYATPLSTIATHALHICRLRADCSPLSTGILYSRLHRVMIPDAVIIKFVLLKMGMMMLETCRGL
jgi:hypothetical protein